MLRRIRFQTAIAVIVALIVVVLSLTSRASGQQAAVFPVGDYEVVAEYSQHEYDVFADDEVIQILQRLEATATATALPTATMEATQTPLPTNTPEPTETPDTGPIEPYPDAPPCPTHDDRAWHGLWDYERGCHYDHHHGDDPSLLDGVLGTQIYELQGGEISSPWQTVSAEGYLENNTKHTGYVWYVRENIPCATSPCVSNLRVVVHQHTLHDASVRFHSYTMEGTTSDGGYFLLGGHMDFGDLHAPEGTVVFNVEGNHCGRTANPGNHKQHAVEGGSRAPSNIWYGRSRTNSDVTVDRSCGFAQIGTSAQDPWVWASQTEPFLGDYVCYPNPRCRVNATAYRLHLFSLRMDVRGFDFLYEDGIANFEGWADRYGVPYEDESACSEPGIDCTPFVVRGLQQGTAYRTNGAYTEQMYRDYDVYFDGQTANWARPEH